MIFKGLITLSLALTLASCAAPVQRITNTPSGKPEVQIDNIDVESVRSRLIERTMNAGFRLDADSPNRIVVSQELRGMQETLWRMTLSNSYSTTVRAETAMTLVKNAGGVHVYAQTMASSTMPLGQVKTAEMNDPSTFNTLQVSLERLRDSFLARP